jgi:hypothetical protein
MVAAENPTAEEWLELSTRLRDRPPAVIDASRPAAPKDVVLRIRIPKRLWRSQGGATPLVGSSRRGLGDRLYSLLCQ